jgi:hypothetical protein
MRTAHCAKAVLAKTPVRFSRVPTLPLGNITFDLPAPPSYGYNHVRTRFGQLLDSSGQDCSYRVAVKEVSLARAAREAISKDAAARLRQEAAMLVRGGSHPGILHCFGICEVHEGDDHVLRLVTEECAVGTLASWKDATSLPDSKRVFVCFVYQSLRVNIPQVWQPLCWGLGPK